MFCSSIVGRPKKFSLRSIWNLKKSWLKCGCCVLIPAELAVLDDVEEFGCLNNIGSVVVEGEGQGWTRTGVQINVHYNCFQQSINVITTKDFLFLFVVVKLRRLIRQWVVEDVIRLSNSCVIIWGAISAYTHLVTKLSHDRLAVGMMLMKRRSLRVSGFDTLGMAVTGCIPCSWWLPWILNETLTMERNSLTSSDANSFVSFMSRSTEVIDLLCWKACNFLYTFNSSTSGGRAGVGRKAIRIVGSSLGRRWQMEKWVINAAAASGVVRWLAQGNELDRLFRPHISLIFP